MSPPPATPKRPAKPTRGLEPRTPTLSMGGAGSPHEPPTSYTQAPGEADAGTRTPDPFITSEVLYQLSYVGTRRHGTQWRRGPG
jgi:hypothetical protein